MRKLLLASLPLALCALVSAADPYTQKPAAAP